MTAYIRVQIWDLGDEGELYPRYLGVTTKAPRKRLLNLLKRGKESQVNSMWGSTVCRRAGWGKALSSEFQELDS